MIIRTIEDSTTKREIISLCDSVFSNPLSSRSNGEEIVSRIIDNAVFLAAYNEADALGYAAIYLNDTVTHTGYLTMLGVLEDMQGHHVGSALMQGCIDLAIEKGMSQIRLEVSKTDTNDIAIYKHWGFVYEKDCSDVSYYMVKTL